MADERPRQLPPVNDRPAYTNFAKIRHRSTEFFLDFAILYAPLNDDQAQGLKDGHAYGQVVGRLMMTPMTAKQLALALTDNIKKFEEQHGTIGIAPVQERTDITLN